jgi:signal transduction histidine kinase
MRLARKLSLGLFIGVLFVVAVSAYLRLQREMSLFDTDMRRDQRLIGTTLAAALDEVWRAEGEARVLDLVRRADAAKADLYIRWVRFDSDAAQEHRPLVDAIQSELPGPFQALDRVAAISGQNGTPPGERILTYVPLPKHGAAVAALEVSESTSPKFNYVKASLLGIVASSFAMALVSGALAMVLGAWFVGRPVEALIGRARAIGAGDFEGRLDLQRSDEFGALAAELDSTSRELAQARDRIGAETAARIAAVEQLRHAERLTTLGRLASVIAHEIGTPLGVVAGYAQMISTAKVSGADSREAAGVMSQQCERISRMVRRVLDYARRSEPKKQPTSLGDVLNATSVLLQPLAEKRGVRLSFERSRELDVTMDSAQVQQAVTNLVINAVQASNPGDVVKIDLDVVRTRGRLDTAESEYARVSVQDAGSGIAADTIERIWEPFFTTKPSSEGTGLGLSITKDIVEEHGGFATVQTHPGSGSRFEIYLPLGAS